MALECQPLGTVSVRLQTGLSRESYMLPPEELRYEHLRHLAVELVERKVMGLSWRSVEKGSTGERARIQGAGMGGIPRRNPRGCAQMPMVGHGDTRGVCSKSD